MKFKIDSNLLYDVLNIKNLKNVEFLYLNFIDSFDNDTLTYCNDEKYIQTILDNNNISGVITSPNLKRKFSSRNIIVIECEDPTYCYFSLYNYIAKKKYVKIATDIHPMALIHKKAYVSDYNVKIGKNTIVEPNVTILPDVEIGNDCIIRAGAVVGSEGYEHKKTQSGIISTIHDGHVKIGDFVEVGANTCIDKGLSEHETIIEDFTKIDNLVHIAHGVHIGKRCFIVACSMISGSVKIHDDTWIGPNSSISNKVNIGENAFVTIGAVVVNNVKNGEQVTGNFAIQHNKFLKYFLKIMSNK